MAEYGLLVAFTDESPSYVQGWEGGMLYQRMMIEAGPIETTIHTENRETITRCCGSLGWQAEFQDTDMPGWTNAVLTRAGKPRLSVVA